MTYCQEIEQLLTAAELVRVSVGKFEGDDRFARYHVVATANHFIPPGGRKFDLAAFNKRCNPPLTIQELEAHNLHVAQNISALQNIQAAADTANQENGVVTVDDADAVAFLSDHPMRRIRDQYYCLHYGDDDALHTVIWGYCVKWIDNAVDEGIHVIAIGERGAGKSHGITSAMEFLPAEYAWIKGISARYLYYAKNLIRGLTIYLDDIPADPNLLDSLKAIITAYPKGGKRGTVINGESLEQSIPARITINTSSVDQKADEQFTNRMTVIRANTNPETKRHRVDFRLQLYEGETTPVCEQEKARIHNALRHLSRRTFNVRVPKDAIKCDNPDHIDVRVLNQFMCAVFGNAILNYPNRHPVADGDFVRITVSKEDFDAVIHLYQNPDEYNYKLTDACIAIKNYLGKVFPEHKTIGEISEATTISEQTVRRSICGRKDRAVDSLIEAGLVEELSQTTQEKEVVTGSSGVEYTKPVGVRLTSKVYRATKLAILSGKQKKKKPDTPSCGLTDFVAMVRWVEVSELHMQEDDSDGEFPSDPSFPPVSQGLGNPITDVSSTIVSQLSQNISGGGK